MYETHYHRASSYPGCREHNSSRPQARANISPAGMTLIADDEAAACRADRPHRSQACRGNEGHQGDGANREDRCCGTTHFDVASSAELAAVCPAISGLASHIGDPHVRHMGTIGGSIANNDPAADYPSAMLALDATIVTDKRGNCRRRFLHRSFRDRARRRRTGDRDRLRGSGKGSLRRSSPTRPRATP